MQIAIQNRQRKFPLDEEQVRSWTQEILIMEEIDDGEIGLVFVNNRRIRTFNTDYRQINRATDVLAFPMREGIGGDLHPDFLGDVMISLERTDSDARRFERDYLSHLLILLIHGTLHLLGYDHTRSTEEENRMQDRENLIFKAITQSEV